MIAANLLIKRTTSEMKLDDFVVEKMEPDCATIMFRVDGAALTNNAKFTQGVPVVRHLSLSGDDVVALYNIITSGRRVEFHRWARTGG